MKITLYVYDILKEKIDAGLSLEDGRLTMNISEGAHITDLLKAIGLKNDSIGLVIVNGRQAMPGDKLCEGDQVQFFSPLSGG